MYKIATIHVSGVKALALDRRDIPAGITGAVLELVYDDPIWDNLVKTVVFQGTKMVQVFNAGSIVKFPPEVAAAKNTNVKVGVYGVDSDGLAVIPTLWADLGVVKPSAAGSFPPPQEQTPPLWVQALGSIGDLAKLDTENRENLVAAINEVLGKVGSGGGNVDLSGYAKVEQLPDSTSDLVNDSGFITRLVTDLANYYAKSETYSREEIDQKVSSIPKFSVAVVTALPSENISDTTIYLLTTGSATGDLYSEWIWANGKWELLGSQRVDLTGYAKEDWVRQQLAEYQPKGDYLTEVPEGYATEEFVEKALADANIGADEVYVVPEGGTIEDAAPATIIVDLNGEADLPVGGVSLNVTGAAVGQTVKIAAVDENGAPTAWEPVDLPSGGGGWGEWETINVITTTLDDQVSEINVTTDADGNPFEYDELKISFRPLYGSAKSDCSIWVNRAGYAWNRKANMSGMLITNGQEQVTHLSELLKDVNGIWLASAHSNRSTPFAMWSAEGTGKYTAFGFKAMTDGVYINVILTVQGRNRA